MFLRPCASACEPKSAFSFTLPIERNLDKIGKRPRRVAYKKRGICSAVGDYGLKMMMMMNWGKDKKEGYIFDLYVCMFARPNVFS